MYVCTHIYIACNIVSVSKYKLTFMKPNFPTIVWTSNRKHKCKHSHRKKGNGNVEIILVTANYNRHSAPAFPKETQQTTITYSRRNVFYMFSFFLCDMFMPWFAVSLCTREGWIETGCPLKLVNKRKDPISSPLVARLKSNPDCRAKVHLAQPLADGVIPC